MNLMLIGAAALALLALLAWWMRRRAAAGRSAPAERLDTVIGWPPSATRILSNHERQAYATLTRAMPECLVFAQVPLARFVKVPKRNSYSEWLRRAGNQRADLVLCDTDTQVLAVVNLQAPGSAASERAQKRQQRMARVLKAASIPLHLWTEGVLPSDEAARSQLRPSPPAVPAAAAPAPAQPSAPQPAMAHANAARPPLASPFEDSARDSTHDELIEMREPPPSTWFDDLDDTGHAPLTPPKR